MQPTKQSIEEAYQMILPHIHVTPVLTSQSLNTMVGVQLYFKCENFQKGGAYKARGACYNILMLTEEERNKGVCTHSSGNHGSCLAKMAQQFNVHATIVMPQNSPIVKIKATESYGGQVVMSGNTQVDREAVLSKVQSEQQCVYVPPFDSWRTITGAGTVALEFLQQQQDLDIILVPIGGGGICSGTLIAADGRVQVIGVEPELASDALQSIRSGVLHDQMPVKTIADGLRTKLGEKPFSVIKGTINDIWTVNEEEIVAATVLIWERLKIFVETSSATVLAAAIKHKDDLKNKKVGLILTGGNVDMQMMKQYL